MERTIYNCITGETVTIYSGDEENAPRVATFIKCNTLLPRETIEERYGRVYEQMQRGIVVVDHDIKIVFVDIETGQTITEI